MIRNVHLGSGSWFFYPSRIPGSESATLFLPYCDHPFLREGGNTGRKPQSRSHRVLPPPYPSYPQHKQFMQPKSRNQCSGSGSESGSGSTGSTCFWASWIRIRILLSLSKNSKKNLNFYSFVTSFWLLSLKNDVKVPSKSTMQKNFFF